MASLQRQLKVANKKAVEAISNFDDTLNAILYLCPTGEGAKDSVKQEMKNSKEYLVSFTIEDGTIISIIIHCENRAQAIFTSGTSLQKFILENPYQDQIKGEFIDVQVSELSPNLVKKEDGVERAYIYTPEDVL